METYKQDLFLINRQNILFRVSEARLELGTFSLIMQDPTKV